MSKLVLDSTMVSQLSEMCDADLLSMRIELIGEVIDNLIAQLGETEDEAERKRLTDWMVSLHDIGMDFKGLRRAQR